MKKHVYCPGCGFRGKLPASLGALTSVVCPQCRTTVPVDQLDNYQQRTSDETFPIRVDPSRPDLELPPLPAAQPVLPRAAARNAVRRAEEPLPVAEEVPITYTGNFMKAEAAQFEQYVNARLAELKKKRAALADAESKFEQLTMAQKQDIGRAHVANAAEADRLRARDTELTARTAELVAREAALADREADLAAREVELAARDQQLARIEALATEPDRRFAELRATLDRIEAKRVALADERAALERRTAELERAEIDMHRREVELDEMEVRLRQNIDDSRAGLPVG